jgi:competence protein ComEA
MSLADRLAIATLVAAVAALGLGAWLFLAPTESLDSAADPFDPFGGDPLSASPDAYAAAGVVVVDVEGGVLRPGIVELPDGTRVADAIAAAGGYSRDADLAAAATSVNLAAFVSDGQQIFVPLLGAPGGGAGGGGGVGSGPALVNLNTASPEALDALPGIGPVTVQKIVAARAEEPFRSLDELVSREVLTRSQLDKVRDLVTVT